ncbi:MAG TPA: DUF481 domain-containing protein [Agriterribacter sp.]|nr:DUF481 domain-containing protein [Agriterribacter sp.]HRQ52129.1 DUF481 domain-containing protein [Agriterribacter sp.]
MMNFSRIVFSLLLVTMYIPAGAQIVNVESRRIQTDTTGWAGSFGGNINLSKNVEQVFSAGAFAHLQYKNSRNLYLFLGDYSFLKGAQKKYTDNTFFHLRYNHKFSNLTRWEAFTQLQTNKITKIDNRFLAGMGPRFKLSGSGMLHIYLGVLFMYEYERELVDPPVAHHNIRNSSYLSFTLKPAATLELISTTFYQPRLDQWSDFRILNQESANLFITQKLSATVNWSYVYDQFPVEGIPRSNYTFSTGLKYAF